MDNQSILQILKEVNPGDMVEVIISGVPVIGEVSVEEKELVFITVTTSEILYIGNKTFIPSMETITAVRILDASKYPNAKAKSLKPHPTLEPDRLYAPRIIADQFWFTPFEALEVKEKYLRTAVRYTNKFYAEGMDYQVGALADVDQTKAKPFILGNGDRARYISVPVENIT